ncbi:unnamed protein product [Auanema sp. JU1783]|nr:unnamed protein product [Auanema sp. JU1783]
MRLSNEYIGDLIENSLGSRARNTYTRFLMRVAFIIPFRCPEDINVHNDVIGGVRVRVYSSLEKKSKSAMIYIHGGGWSVMKPEYYDPMMFSFVHNLGITIFSIDYRLAPEFPFPAGLDDCVKVVTTLYEERHEAYGIDRNKMFIAGDSAGGNLTASTTQRLANNNLNFIKCQILIYPVIHVFGFQSPSYLEHFKLFKGTSILSPAAMARWTLFYMGIRANQSNIAKLLKNQHISEDLKSSPEFGKLLSSAKLPKEIIAGSSVDAEEFEPDKELSEKISKLGTDPWLSPIFGVTSDLPPTLVITQGYDILRDEGILYAKRLKECNVECEWKHYKNGYHAIFNMPKSPLRKVVAQDTFNFIRKYL